MDALVSVVLPFRNSPFLARAIQSILDQTYANFELLLINNNSDAESAAVAKSYEGRDHRIKYLHEARAGVAHAMNRGIQEASGNYIARMDADDYSFPNRLENQVAMLERNPVLSAVAGKVEYEGEKENRGFQLFVDWQNQLVAEQDIYNSQFVELPLVNPTLMFRSEVFKDRLYRQGDFPEDYEFFLYLMSIDVCVGKSPECVLKWTDSSNRLSRTDVRYSRDAFYLCKTPYLVEWLKKNNPFFPKVWIWGGGKVAR
ncbi:MAG: glycosyltransferase family A protein, partial [Bacteroidota bacterium]